MIQFYLLGLALTVVLVGAVFSHAVSKSESMSLFKATLGVVFWPLTWLLVVGMVVGLLAHERTKEL